MGRRFLHAYTEGLVMTCPLHRAEMFFNGQDQPGTQPAAIDKSQDNVQATLRPEFSGAYSNVRH
ncbi:hypothetical protein [Novosphingobium sp.]